MNKKITELTALSSVNDSDLIEIVDVSDISVAATGNNKKITKANLVSDIYRKTEVYTKAEADTAFVENSQIDTDGTLAANSDTKIPSQKAVKTYADTKTTLATVQQDVSTNYGMARQAIMNGNFDVWQRGTSVALADVTVAYQADRFYDVIDKNGGTLPTLTRSRQILTSGDIANAFYHTRLATNGAGTSLGVSSYGVYVQKIENGVRNLCGLNKKVTVSFYAKSDIANKRICPTLIQTYGTGGSPSAAEVIKGTPITLTSSWTKYTATFTTNTLVGKTFGTANDDYLSVDINYMWGTTWGNANVQTSVTAETFVGSGNIDIAQVQLCSGDVALPFQPKSFEEELRACQRYYEKSYDYVDAPATNTTNGLISCHGNVASAGTGYMGLWIPFKVRKRYRAATIVIYDSAGNANKCRRFTLGVSNNNNQTVANNNSDEYGVTVYSSGSSSNAGMAVQFTAESEL